MTYGPQLCGDCLIHKPWNKDAYQTTSISWKVTGLFIRLRYTFPERQYVVSHPGGDNVWHPAWGLSIPSDIYMSMVYWPRLGWFLMVDSRPWNEQLAPENAWLEDGSFPFGAKRHIFRGVSVLVSGISNPNNIAGWWFLIFLVIFTPLWGRFPFWRAYFSNGLVQPPTR